MPAVRADMHECLDVTLAVELFEWTYRRSIEKYQVVVESMGGPDPMRLRYREQLGEAIRKIVYFGARLDQAVTSLSIPDADITVFNAMLKAELQYLEPYNCARYRLPIGKTQEWIDLGRPS